MQYAKKEIISVLESLIQDRLDEIQGVSRAKKEPDALYLLLRRLGKIFSSFAGGINSIVPKDLQGDVEFKDMEHDNEPFLEKIKKFNAGVKMPETVNTYETRNNEQLPYCSEDIKKIISKMNELYRHASEQYNGQPGRGNGLSNCIKRMKLHIRDYENWKERAKEKLKTNNEDYFEESNTKIDKFYFVIDTAYKQYPDVETTFQNTKFQHVARALLNQVNALAARKGILNKNFLANKKRFRSELAEFLRQDFKRLVDTKLLIKGELGNVENGAVPQVDTFAYHFKKLHRLIFHLREQYVKLEDIYKERYGSRSLRAESGDVTFNTAISIFEKFGRDILEFSEMSIDSVMKKVVYDSEEEAAQSINSLLVLSKEQNYIEDNFEQMTARYRIFVKDIKKQMISFYTSSGSSFADAKDKEREGTLLGRKIKMINDLWTKFNKEIKDEAQTLMKVNVENIIDEFTKLYKQRDETGYKGYSEQNTVVQNNIAFLKNHIKDIIAAKIKEYMNGFVKYYITNYNKSYIPISFDLDQDHSVDYEKNEYLESYVILSDMLRKNSLDMSTILDPQLFSGYYNAYYKPERFKDIVKQDTEYKKPDIFSRSKYKRYIGDVD